MLVDSEKLGSGAAMSEAEKMQRERKGTVSLKGIVTYDWSPDGKSILVPLDGVLYLAGVDGTVTVAKGTGKGEMLNPVLSETGKYLSFVRDNRLWVGPVGSADQADHAGRRHARPLGRSRIRRAGRAGSLDRLLVVAQGRSHRGRTVRRGAGRCRHPRRDRRRGHQDLRAALSRRRHQQRRCVALRHRPRRRPQGQGRPRRDRDIYLARVDWAPDGKTLYVQRAEPRADRLDMLAVDPATGKSRILFSEKAAPQHWINLTDNYKFLDDGSLIWWSERDGFGHLYRFADGKWTQLTSGPWVGHRPRRRRPAVAPVVLRREQGRSARAAGLFDRLSQPRRAAAADRPRLCQWRVDGQEGQTLLVARSSPSAAAAGLSRRRRTASG